MAKKELPDKLPPKGKDIAIENTGGLTGDFSAKLSALSSGLFAALKVLLAVLILPLVYSTVISFMNEFAQIDMHLRQIFWNGIVTFLVIYLFVWEPVKVYNKGHKLLEIMFSFFKPMVNVAPFLLPIYTIVFFILYAILSVGIKDEWLIRYALFLVGFSTILHLTFSAKTIRSKKGDLLKSNYIFGFSFIFILNLSLLALGLSLIFSQFSLVNFCNTSFNIAGSIFHAVFKQLFLFK